MSIVKTMGIVILVMLALWLIFGVVGILTAILRSVILVLIVVAAVYGAYHFLRKH